MKKLVSALLLGILLTGCASTTMDTAENDRVAKQFNLPEKGKSGLYIYRDSTFGGALKKNLYVDDRFIGESAPKVFFYKQLTPGIHKISTESEFGQNHIKIRTRADQNYFIRQYIKMGGFVGGANLEEVTESQGMEAVSKLKLALTY